MARHPNPALIVVAAAALTVATTISIQVAAESSNSLQPLPQDTKTWPATEAGASCRLDTTGSLKLLDSASRGIAKTSSELSKLRDQLHKTACSEKLPPELKKQMSMRCSDYFRQVGKGLQDLGIRVGDEWTDPNLQANDIIGRMVKSPSQWQQITSEVQAQQLANSGVIVEAVTYGPEQGHLAAVSPAPSGIKPTVETPGGTPFGPPFVRDGNEHAWRVCEKGGRQRKLYPSSGGAVSEKIVFYDFDKHQPLPVCGEGQAPNGCVGLYAWRPSWIAASSNLRACERKAEQAKKEPSKHNKKSSGAGKAVAITGLVGGAVAGGVVAAQQLNKSSSGQLSGHCVSTFGGSTVNACGPCTCTPNNCGNSPQCGGGTCWTSSPVPPFC